jgi:predicted metal-binding protein
VSVLRTLGPGIFISGLNCFISITHSRQASFDKESMFISVANCKGISGTKFFSYS